MKAWARFMSKVAITESCWNWIGDVQSNGYGRFTIGHRDYRAHRYSYEEIKGEIPEGFEIDHLCRNRLCVNPDHLEAVTRRENLRRSTAPTARNIDATHCVHGHEFTAENTYIYTHRDGGIRRSCRTCDRERKRARYWARKGVRHAA